MASGQDGQSWGSGIEGPLRILVCEPDDRRRRVLASELRSLPGDVRVREAEGFVSGLGALRVDRFAFLLVARSLPDGDALRFVSLLKNIDAAGTPLVFVVDEDDAEFEAAALEAGAEDVILREDATGRALRRLVRGAMTRASLRSDLARANGRLERIAVNEPLTGLLNRRGLELALQREQALGLRKGVDNHLLLVDLDDFKKVNARHGYDVGDRMLQEVARALEHTVRRTDHVARIGGDEFLVLLPDSKLAAGLRLAERIRARLESIKIRSPKGTLSVRASLGVSRVPGDARTVPDLVAGLGGALDSSRQRGARADGGDAPVGETTGRIRTLAEGADLNLQSSIYLAQPITHLADGEVLAHWVLAPGSPLVSQGVDSSMDLPEADSVRVAGDRRALEGAVEAAGVSEELAACFFSCHPATLLHTPAPRLKGLLGQAGGRAGRSLMLGDHHITGDPSALVEPVQRLRDAGVGLGLRQVGFSRDSLEAVVLLRPRLVTLRLAHLMGPKREERRIGMIKRLVRTLEALVPDIVLEGIVSEEDRELADEFGVSYGIGSGVGGVTVITNEPE